MNQSKLDLELIANEFIDAKHPDHVFLSLLAT